MKMRSYLEVASAGIFAVVFFCAATTALAGTITAPPNSSYFQNVAADVPEYGNVWNGVAQSFTAQDASIEAGFYIVNYSGRNLTNTELQYSLYSGSGTMGSPIDVIDTSVSMEESAPPSLILSNFSTTFLVPGQQYTIAASMPGFAYPPLGAYSDLGISYNSISDDTFGSFYYTGSAYNSGFNDRTLAFDVQAVSAAPEPCTWLLMLASIGGIGLMLRQARQIMEFRVKGALSA